MQILPIILIGALVAVAAFTIEKQTSILTGRPTPTLLKAWGEQHLTDEEVKQWLASLNAQETKQLLRQFNQFCKQENISPNMLFHDQFDNNNALREYVTDVASSYLHASWRRAAIREDLAAHLFFAGYQKSPKRKKYRDFSRDLYLGLIQAKLIETPSLSDSIMQTERKQQKAAQEAILQVAQVNRPAFNTVLKEALRKATPTD